MIFQLGKTKSSAERKLEIDQAPRWRQPNLIRESEDEQVVLSGPVPAQQQVEREVWKDQEENKQPVVQLSEPVTVKREQVNEWVNKVDLVAHRLATGQSIDNDTFRRLGSGIKTAIGPGTVIEGRFSFDAPVRIDGDLTGEVTSTSTLIVGEQAIVRATIKVGSLIVFGKVIGDVEAQDLVEVKSGGFLEANISTDRIAIEEGAYYKGAINL